MLDDLRRSASDDFEDDFDSGDDGGSGEDAAEIASGGLFLGMTAVERMFISIFLFLNVCVIGFGLLLATGRIQL